MPELSANTYSEVDGSNNQAAPNGMPEGMPPSGVNDAWRAGMGAIKRSYDRDHAGTWCTVGGTGNAITLTYAVAPAGYVQGEKYAFKAIAANSGATTVNINGLGAKNVFKKSPAGTATACTGNEIQNGDLIEIEYDGTQFQLLAVAATTFVGGTLTATTAMSGVAFNEAAQVPLASAPTTDIGAIASNYANVTGSATVTSFGAVVNGARRSLFFSGTPLLTNNANIALPGGANVQTVSGDVATFIGDGVWRCVNYLRGPASAATTLTGTDPMAFLTAAGFAGNKSLGANGYYKLPGGLILQWGSLLIPGVTAGTFTYPTAFPNNFFAGVITPVQAGGIGAESTFNSTPGLSSAVVYNASGNALTHYIFVIGN
jgi:hypothetical protein